MRRIPDYHEGPRAYHSLIPLCAADAGYHEAFAIGCGGKNFGRVYHVHDHHLNEPPPPPLAVAGSLAEFLASIVVVVPPSIHEFDDD